MSVEEIVSEYETEFTLLAALKGGDGRIAERFSPTGLTLDDPDRISSMSLRAHDADGDIVKFPLKLVAEWEYPVAEPMLLAHARPTLIQTGRTLAGRLD